MGILSFVGCSTSPFQTLLADSTVQQAQTDESHALLGYYTFICDPNNSTVEVVTLRGSALHLNALKFLEPPPNLHLSLEGPVYFNGDVIDVNIGLRNPYLGLVEFTGFDICGIVITRGSLTGFHDPGIVMAGEGDTRLLNADGYTRWWNPSEFPHGETVFCYKDGLLGTPDDVADFNCTINGYKYFADGLEPDDPLTWLATGNRGMFSAGQKNVRHYTINISDGLIFNYAVDACWAIPQGDIPYDIPDDFPPKANRPEAYNMVITELENTLYHDDTSGFTGGKLKLQIDIRDHYNASENVVFAESEVGFPFKNATQVSGGEDSAIHEIEWSGIGISHSGAADILVTVQSEVVGYGNILQDEPVCAYFKYTTNIADIGPKGWARTWGSDFVAEGCPSYYAAKDERGSGVATDSFGYVYSIGYFGNSIDFDPGPGIEMRESNGGFDMFLVKYDPYGLYTWALTWGGEGHDRCRGLYIDDSDDIFITGDFIGTADFDPGPGSDVHQSHNPTLSDAFLSKFNKEGIHQWTLTWGGTNATTPYKVIKDHTGHLYVGGEYIGTTDFNPGPGVDEHIGDANDFDAFVMKLDQSGNYIWAKTWGGNYRQAVVNIDFDSSNNPFFTGSFYGSGTTDFNPGPGVELLSCHGYSDPYLSKFDQDGNFLWAKSWGGSAGYDQANGIKVLDSDDVFITGRFVGAVDFDPGDGINIVTANGGADAFASRFDCDGNWLGVKTLSGDGVTVATCIASDNLGGLLMTGDFSSTVDFDPGPGTYELTSSGGRDAFLGKYTTEGDLIWALAWGGESTGGTFGDRAGCVTADPDGNMFVAGNFEETCDFFPGPDVDLRTSNGGTDIFLARFGPDGNW